MRRVLVVTAGLLIGVVVAAGLVVFVVRSQTATTPIPAKSENTPTVAAPTPGLVLLDISGRDTKQSQVFTAPSSWAVTWEVEGDENASGEILTANLFDTKGNPVRPVFESQLDPGVKRSDVTHMHLAGTFYVEITGIGIWHIKAVTT
jgi:hypothetical protein